MTATQLVNPEIDRVDAVNGPATGLPFLMFKSLDGPAEEAPAEVTKAEDDPAAPAAEQEPAEVAKSEEEAPAGSVKDAVAKAAEEAEEAPAEEVAKSEQEDADKAAKAAKTLAALRQVVQDLAASEDAEEPYSSDAWDLMDAGSAIDYALGILAKFALTEAIDATVEKAQTDALRKALHLEVHEKHDEEEQPPAAAPGEHEAPAAHEEAPAAHEAPAAPTAKATKEEPLPSGLQEILDTFVESYAKFKENKDNAAALADDDVEQEALTAPAPAPAKEAEPAGAAEPASEPAAAPATHPAPAEAAPAAPAAEEDPKAKKVVKSMDELIAEAVAKAVAEAKEPLLKQIDQLERMPNDSGSPMLAGQTPGHAGVPFGSGQQEAVAKGLTQPATAQSAPGAFALVEALKGVHQGNR